MEADTPGFFASLAEQQKPAYLWIGCSDSRVPANQITGLMPGEVFVHRNIANVVLPTDLNCMSVIDYAVSVLSVKHIIVCGHYGCGGVNAAISGGTTGAVDHWLSGIRELWEAHKTDLEKLDEAEASTRLCELNVQQQVGSLARVTAIRNAWERGQTLQLHGWIYGIQDGLLRDLGASISSPADSG
jgi:carbonic anhydrase